MINEKELDISNQSPIHKDFYQIYPEILEIASKISSRWDPASSNESDPGVVLLKLLAFIADKNNYIIDKSILEAFMPSATQEDSMRKLCEMMGYEMKYYNSATTEVTFTYNGQLDENNVDKLEDGSFTLDKFTSITSEDDSVNYVTTEAVTISDDDRSKVVTAIEGTLCEVTVGDSDVVKINNLDDLNRFYLPESMIAQNGVFVYTGNSTEEWQRVNNLNLYELGSTIFKFGFDSKKQLPYLEFPNDINNLISDGLKVKYIRTSGINGNINKGVLSKLSGKTYIETSNGTTIDLSTEEEQQSLSIVNKSASYNGSNSESLDDAYNGFKKTVGTFNTLVTCRDYANAIYNLVDSFNNPLISNIQVADIRNHPTRSNNVVTYNEYGLTTEEAAYTEDIDSFDLFLYPFGISYNYWDIDNYKSSFRPNVESINLIKSELSNHKTLSHKIKTVDSDELYCYKGYYDLKAKITTTYKVNSLEESNILKNVYKALYTEFNSRKVDFGEKIPFDSILECIQNSDTRIKNVSLEEPDINIKYMTKNLIEKDLLDSTNRIPYLNMLAKNILAGRIALFDYNISFKYDYNQSNSEVFGGEDVEHKIIALDTELKIKESITNYTLKENEVIQFIAPNFNTVVTYPAYINYYFKMHGTHTISDYIKANSEYQLVDGDELYINYTDSNDVIQNIKYTDKGKWVNNIKDINFDKTIIKPNFDLPDSADKKASDPYLLWKKTTGFDASWDIPGMFALDVNQQIETRYEVKSILTSKSILACWILKNSENHFDWDEENSYILKDGEYFFYTDTNKSSLIILGSGTKIIADTDLQSQFNINFNSNNGKDLVDLTKVASDGLGAFTDDNWVNIKINSDKQLIFQEMTLVTLAEGDTLFGIDLTSASYIDNEWHEINEATGQFSTGSPLELPNLNVGEGGKWLVRSRLDLNMGPELSQHLINEEDKVTQRIRVRYDNYNPESPSSGTYVDIEPGSSDTLYIMSNQPLQQAGKEDIDVRIYKVKFDLNGEETREYINDFSILKYNLDNVTYSDNNESGESGDESILTTGTLDNNYTTIDLAKINNLTLNINTPENNFGLIMFYYTPSTAVESGGGVMLISEDSVLRNYNELESESSFVDYSPGILLNKGINIIQIKEETNGKLVINNNGDYEGTLVFSNIDIVKNYITSTNGVNKSFLDISTSECLDLLKLINKYSNEIFYYNNPINDSQLIDVDKMSDINALYSYNNIYNNFIISELNADKFSEGITLTKSSRK